MVFKDVVTVSFINLSHAILCYSVTGETLEYAVFKLFCHKMSYCGLKKSPQPSLHAISRIWMFMYSDKIDR